MRTQSAGNIPIQSFMWKINTTNKRIFADLSYFLMLDMENYRDDIKMAYEGKIR